MSSAMLAARKARASDVPATDMLAEAIAYVRPRLEEASPIGDRLRVLWAGVAAARDLAAADVIEAEFLLLARDTQLTADLGRHAETDNPVGDARHEPVSMRATMNPFGERFERKFARAQDQVARKPDGHRYNASKPQDLDVANDAMAALVSRCAADIAPEKIEWLWPGRLALGKHICIAGEPGTGKSQLLIAIVAAVTTGGNWPCGEGRAPIGNVIILSAEDGPADTIIPRLQAAGADRNRVHLVSAVRNADGSRRTLNLQHDLDLLERKIGEIGDVALVGVDPVSSYLGKTDSHKNSEVRGVLEPLSEMAERTRVAVLSVTHFSKAGAKNTTKALHRFIGSIAFTGAPRAAFAVIEDAEHDGRRLFLHAKNNLARAPQGLAFRLEQCIIGEDIVVSPDLVGYEPVAITADEALAADVAGTETRTAKAEAMEFLQAVLAGEPVPASEVNRMAREHGLSTKAVRSARETLRIKIERDGFGLGSKSLWSLPKGA